MRNPTPTPRPPVRDGSDLQHAAETLESEQQAALESATVDQAYTTLLVGYVAAMGNRVEAIEDRLESLVDQQSTRVQQSQASRPGLLAMPSARTAWQHGQQRQQARLNTLRSRLDTVREISDGMGLHQPRIEEMATRKLRLEHPEIAGDWDAMREAARLHQVKELERARKKEQEQRRSRSQSQRLDSDGFF